MKTYEGVEYISMHS